MLLRIAIVLGLLGVFAAAPALYRRRQRRLQRGPDVHPPVPVSLRQGALRTWVVFTTPWCAACGPVEARLRASDPEARVVRVDATRDPDLAGSFAVRAAPTAVLADHEGRVQTRLVGAEAVEQYLVSAGS